MVSRAKEIFDLLGSPVLEERHVKTLQIARPVLQTDGAGGFSEIVGETSDLNCDPVLFDQDGEMILSVDVDEDILVGDLIFIDYN
jgi:hypothetical protein